MRRSAPRRSVAQPPRTPRCGTSWWAATAGGVELFLRGLEVGVRARGVIGDVDDASDCGHHLREHPLDPLAQRDVGHAAALASAAHAQQANGAWPADQLAAPPVAPPP